MELKKRKEVVFPKSLSTSRFIPFEPLKRKREVSKMEKTEIFSTFDYYDSKSKGFLTKYEYKLAFISLMGFRPTKFDITEMQQIGKREFVKKISKRFERMDDIDRIKQIFNSFDSDYKGFVKLKDMKRIFGEISPHISSMVVEQIFHEFDSKKNGRITLKDFEEMVKINE